MGRRCAAGGSGNHTVRILPIVWLALAAGLALVPLALAGSNSIGLSYTSFSLALIGGMSSATLLTLLVVPVFYTLFDDARIALSRSVRRGLGTESTPKAPAEASAEATAS